MRKIRKSKPLEQAIEQYTLYHTVVYLSLIHISEPTRPY